MHDAAQKVPINKFESKSYIARPDISPLSINAHESLQTEISHYTVFRYIATLDSAPHFTVKKHCFYIGVWVYVSVTKVKMYLF